MPETKSKITVRKAFARLEQFRGEGIRCWLNRIVENQCLMRIRYEQDFQFICLIKPRRSLNIAGRTQSVQIASPEKIKHRAWRVITPSAGDFAQHTATSITRHAAAGVDQCRWPSVAGRLGLSVPQRKSSHACLAAEAPSRLKKHCGHAKGKVRSRKRRDIRSRICSRRLAQRLLAG